jgi:hypothetical protein
MERVRHLRTKDPIRADHRRHVRRLDRDLEVEVVEPLEQLDLFERGGDQRLRLITMRQLVEVLRQRTGVGTDAHWDPGALRRLDDLGHALRAADVARVDADRRDARVDRLQRERGVEVDVRDHGNRAETHDRPQRLRVLSLWHRATDDLATGAREHGDLSDRRLDVARRGQRHRLDDDGRTAADGDIADFDGAFA